MEEKQEAGKLGPPVITNKRIFKMHLVLQMTGWDTCKCVHSLYGILQLTLNLLWLHGITHLLIHIINLRLIVYISHIQFAIDI